MKNFDNLYSLDVEADGPCAGLYSMLSFGLVPLNAPEQGFYTTLAPISERFNPGSLKACGFTREQTLAFPPADQAMAKFAQWLDSQPGSGRKVIWSDNPAFDWQFFNYYCHAFLGHNPFGHSARRIGDFFSGTQHDPRNSQGWKKWRTEPHTHNALEDARGNAGALRRVLQVRRPSNSLPQELEVAAYKLPDGARIEASAQKQGPPKWAVRQNGSCLNRQGQWEWEPQPSSRDDRFLIQCRWDTVEQAHRAWKKAATPRPRR